MEWTGASGTGWGSEWKITHCESLFLTQFNDQKKTFINGCGLLWPQCRPHNISACCGLSSQCPADGSIAGVAGSRGADFDTGHCWRWADVVAVVLLAGLPSTFVQLYHGLMDVHGFQWWWQQCMLLSGTDPEGDLAPCSDPVLDGRMGDTRSTWTRTVIERSCLNISTPDFKNGGGRNPKFRRYIPDRASGFQHAVCARSSAAVKRGIVKKRDGKMISRTF